MRGNRFTPQVIIHGETQLQRICECPIHIHDVHRYEFSSFFKWAKCKVLLAHVSGGLVSRVVISPLLFRLSLVLLVNLMDPRRGPVLLYLIGQEMKDWFLLGQ